MRAGHGGGGHSAEELKFIVSSSRREGHLHRFEEDAIQALLELSDYYAREIMVPRNAIVSVSVDASLDQVLRRMREHEYSRLPVYDASPEHIIGYVHYKDMMRIWEERRLANSKRRPLPPFHLSRVLRKPLVVPETKALNDLIDEFRETHIHMAIVVDEFGTIAGLVTLEDALEQIFGEIGDEHDVKRPAPGHRSASLEVDGAITIRDLDTQYGLELPGDAGFETLAGFLLFQLGYIPKPGDAVEYGRRKFTILAMDHNRISRVRIERLPDRPGRNHGFEGGPSLKSSRIKKTRRYILKLHVFLMRGAAVRRAEKRSLPGSLRPAAPTSASRPLITRPTITACSRFSRTIRPSTIRSSRCIAMTRGREIRAGGALLRSVHLRVHQHHGRYRAGHQ